MNELTLFTILSALIMGSSIMVVVGRNPVTSAIFLVMDLFFLAAIYAMLAADFIAVIQILVYAGAIVVLFLFVIMLLNLSPASLKAVKLSPPELLMLGLTVIGFLAIGYQIQAIEGGDAILTRELIEASGGHTYLVGMNLFTKYLWPFELASILILLAVISSVVIARKQPKQEG